MFLLPLLGRVQGGRIGMTVYWHKMVVTENGEDIKELVATNDQLAPLYRQKARYVYTVNNVEDVVLFVFSIYREYNLLVSVFNYLFLSFSRLLSLCLLFSFSLFLSPTFFHYVISI